MDTWHGAIALSEYDGKITRVVHVCDSTEDKRFVVYYMQYLAFQGVYKLISNGVRGNTSDFRSWDSNFDRYFAVDREMLFKFLEDTQHETMEYLRKIYKLKTSAKNNTQQDFEFSYFDDIDDALIEGLSQNQDFFSMLLSNDEMKRQVLGIFSEEIYKSLRESL